MPGQLTLFDVLRHVVVHGPARNPAEAEALTDAIDTAEADATPATKKESQS